MGIPRSNMYQEEQGYHQPQYNQPQYNQPQQPHYDAPPPVYQAPEKGKRNPVVMLFQFIFGCFGCFYVVCFLFFCVFTILILVNPPTYNTSEYDNNYISIPYYNEMTNYTGNNFYSDDTVRLTVSPYYLNNGTTGTLKMCVASEYYWVDGIAQQSVPNSQYYTSSYFNIENCENYNFDTGYGLNICDDQDVYVELDVPYGYSYTLQVLQTTCTGSCTCTDINSDPTWFYAFSIAFLSIYGIVACCCMWGCFGCCAALTIWDSKKRAKAEYQPVYQ